MTDEYTDEALIVVEVAYATPERQLIVPLQVPLGTTALQAVELSNIAAEFAEIDIAKDPMGIFSKPLDGKGRPLPDEYVLSAGDRVEIYRPLLIDPKAARLDRANKENRK
ncbi:MAG: RnfH family protein [Pseudohongiellaceae bacterium]